LTKIERSALVPFSAQQMFDLVKDVDRYVEFLPWCGGSELLFDDGRRFCARIDVERIGIRRSFTTCNVCDGPTRMEITLQHGPFKSLGGSWRFLALREDACKVMLILHFEFSGRLLDAAFERVFHQVVDTMVESFCARAREVYGA